MNKYKVESILFWILGIIFIIALTVIIVLIKNG
jgi:hypothetical protein